MILRKPYAFLIKYFRLIHIILSVFIAYIIYKYADITSFFRENASMNTSSYSLDPSKLVTPYIFIGVILIIIFSLSMYILMRQKKKPTSLYIQTFLYYFILLISVIAANNILHTLTNVSLTNQISRIYRDIFLIISLPQYYFLLFSIIRGIGFDIKKFNFSRDLEELEIKSEDNEEFEFVLGLNTQEHMRKLRRLSREMKYYLVENKVLISIVLTLIFILIMIYIFLNFTIFNKVYAEGEVVNTPNFNFKLNSSSLVDKDLNGLELSDNKKYMILDLNVTNTTDQPQLLEDIGLYLEIDKKAHYHKSSLRTNFTDFGKVYNNDNIAPNSSADYIFIFDFDSSLNIKRPILKVLKSKVGSHSYTNISFDLYEFNDTLKVNKSENEEILLGGKLFKSSKLIIKDINIMPSYEYKYNECIDDNCSSYTGLISTTFPSIQNLLVIDYELALDENVGLKNSIKTDQEFFSNFIKITYNIGEDLALNKLLSKTDPRVSNKVFIEIPKNISELNINVMTREMHNEINYSQ